MESPPAKRAKRTQRAKSDAKSPTGTSDESNSASTSSPAVAQTVDVKRKVPQAKSKAKPVQFTELPEQDILEIMERMELGDICTLAEVCVRFKEIAQRYFHVKYRNANLSLLANTPDGKFTLLKARQLMYNFGHLISTLTIDLNRLNDPGDCSKLLSLVRKYCFSTIDKIEFENQPNERLAEYVVVTMLGMELMVRDAAPGNFGTATKLTFENGKSTQTQTLKQID